MGESVIPMIAHPGEQEKCATCGGSEVYMVVTKWIYSLSVAFTYLRKVSGKHAMCQADMTSLFCFGS